MEEIKMNKLDDILLNFDTLTILYTGGEIKVDEYVNGIKDLLQYAVKGED